MSGAQTSEVELIIDLQLAKDTEYQHSARPLLPPRPSQSMTRKRAYTLQRIFCLSICIFLLSVSFAADEPSSQVKRVGYLSTGSPASELPDERGFWAYLSALGWTEGRNLLPIQRWADGKIERIPRLITQLLDQKVDVIIVTATPAALAAKKATMSVPIVLVAYDRDPVASGVVDSLSKPGGNVTGLFSRQIDLVGKRMELLREMLPRVDRVAVIYDPLRPPNRSDFESAAKQLNVQLIFLAVAAPHALEATVHKANVEADAALVLFSPMLSAQRDRVAAAALRERLPIMCQERELVAAGALISYAPDRDDVLRLVAYYVDRILRGAKPAELPFAEASKFKLAVNLKTANALHLQVPQAILLRADDVIR